MCIHTSFLSILDSQKIYFLNTCSFDWHNKNKFYRYPNSWIKVIFFSFKNYLTYHYHFEKQPALNHWTLRASGHQSPSGEEAVTQLARTMHGGSVSIWSRAFRFVSCPQFCNSSSADPLAWPALIVLLSGWQATRRTHFGVSQRNGDNYIRIPIELLWPLLNK